MFKSFILRSEGGGGGGGFDLSKEDTKQTAHTKTKCEQLPRLAMIEFAVFLLKKKTSRNSSSLLVN